MSDRCSGKLPEYERIERRIIEERGVGVFFIKDRTVLEDHCSKPDKEFEELAQGDVTSKGIRLLTVF
jgi:hypothetical protein